MADTLATPRVTLVVAAARNGVIGREAQLPWQLPDDLKHFKAVTLGKPVIMGRKTFESIGRPLPGRRNLVLSRSEASLPAGVERVASLEEALQRCAQVEEVCVIGGGEIFRLALPLATRVELTRVQADVPGDVHFPELAPPWHELARSEHGVDARHAHAMSFITLVRDAAAAAAAGAR
ncbi:MAG: dihydrofolate reductase [Steroidobacteraceae bacterium]